MGRVDFTNDNWKYRPNTSIKLILDNTQNTVFTNDCCVSLNNVGANCQAEYTPDINHLYVASSEFNPTAFTGIDYDSIESDIFINNFNGYTVPVDIFPYGLSNRLFDSVKNLTIPDLEFSFSDSSCSLLQNSEITYPSSQWMYSFDDNGNTRHFLVLENDTENIAISWLKEDPLVVDDSRIYNLTINLSTTLTYRTATSAASTTGTLSNRFDMVSILKYKSSPISKSTWKTSSYLSTALSLYESSVIVDHYRSRFGGTNWLFEKTIIGGFLSTPATSMNIIRD